MVEAMQVVVVDDSDDPRQRDLEEILFELCTIGLNLDHVIILDQLLNLLLQGELLVDLVLLLCGVCLFVAEF